MKGAVAFCVQRGVVRNGAIEGIPILNQQALVQGVGREWQAAAEQHPSPDFPTAVPFLAAREADDVSVVPRTRNPGLQGKVFTRVLVLTAHQGVGQQSIVPPEQSLLEEHLHPISPALGVEGDSLVSDHPKVRAQIGQCNACVGACRGIGVSLVEAFHRHSRIARGNLFANAHHQLTVGGVGQAFRPVQQGGGAVGTKPSISEDGVGRQLVVDAGIRVPRPSRGKRPARRQTGTELIEWIRQRGQFRQRQSFGGVEQDRTVQPKPCRQSEAVVEQRTRRLGKRTVFGHFEIGTKGHIHIADIGDIDHARCAVVVLRVFRIHPSTDLPDAWQNAVALRPEFVLNFLAHVIQRPGQIDIVVHVFEGGVVEHVSAQHEGPLAVLHVPIPFYALHVIPLL